MKIKSFLSALMPISVAILMAAVSCEPSNSSTEEPEGSAVVQGKVSDSDGEGIEGVLVSSNKASVTATTAADGTYTLSGLPEVTQTIKFAKNGYGDASVTVQAKDLQKGAVTKNITMVFAQSVISGKVVNGMEGGVPVEGATVTLNGTNTTTTNAAGEFRFENLTLNDYVLVAKKDGVGESTVEISKSDFDENGAYVVPTIELSFEILRGLSISQLKNCQPWYANEYRGGKGRGGKELDWSCSFMSACFSNYGGFEYQNEGYTVRINDKSDAGKADQSMFDSYFYGRKLITEDNNIMTVRCRTHNDHSFWGVKVVDLTASSPVAVDVENNNGNTVEDYSSRDYVDFTFDLSAYNGKEIAIAIGLYRWADGAYDTQLPVTKVSFAKSKCEGDSYLPGTEVTGLAGWHMTAEMVRSTMCQTRTSFTADKNVGPEDTPLEPQGGQGYRRWCGTNHIFANLSFMYVSKDIEPAINEGLLIKTSDGAEPNYDLPESYIYGKFDIASGKKLHLTCRNFDGTNPTVIKLVAVKEDGNVVTLTPDTAKNDKISAVENGNGCYKFIHEGGGLDNPEGYTTFEYDLSDAAGKAVIAIGVFKGDTKGGEQKLCIYSIEIK